MKKIDFDIAIPTYNGGKEIESLLHSIDKQCVKPQKIFIIDSNSNDNTVGIASKFGCDVIIINKNEFNHATTRNIGLQRSKSTYIVYLTQDAVLSNSDSLKVLISSAIENDSDITFGRQLPKEDATPIAKAIRLVNYPPLSYTATLNSVYPKGFGKCFNSNSYSCYSVQSLISIGGFEAKTNFGEDTLAAVRILKNGGRVRYEASSEVFHSHNYTMIEELKRNFDIGIFHEFYKQEFRQFGSADAKGIEYISRLFRCELMRGNYFQLLIAFISTASKFIGYRLGRHSKYLPQCIRKRTSMYSKVL